MRSNVAPGVQRPGSATQRPPNLIERRSSPGSRFDSTGGSELGRYDAAPTSSQTTSRLDPAERYDRSRTSATSILSSKRDRPVARYDPARPTDVSRFDPARPSSTSDRYGSSTDRDRGQDRGSDRRSDRSSSPYDRDRGSDRDRPVARYDPARPTDVSRFDPARVSPHRDRRSGSLDQRSKVDSERSGYYHEVQMDDAREGYGRVSADRDLLVRESTDASAERWERSFRATLVLPSPPLTATSSRGQSKKESVPYRLSLHSVQGIRIPERIAREAESLSARLSHRISLSLFDTEERRFFGRTFQGLAQPLPRYCVHLVCGAPLS